MKCPHCPREGRCQGEDVPRLCRLVDPTHRDYRPAYLRVLGPPDPNAPPPPPPPQSEAGHGCCPSVD